MDLPACFFTEGVSDGVCLTVLLFAMYSVRESFARCCPVGVVFTLRCVQAVVFACCLLTWVYLRHGIARLFFSN